MSKPNVIPERSQIAPEFTWNTADLYPSDQAWQEDFSRLQAMVPELAAYAGRLGESADTLYAYVTLEQEAGELLVKPGHGGQDHQPVRGPLPGGLL